MVRKANVQTQSQTIECAALNLVKAIAGSLNLYAIMSKATSELLSFSQIIAVAMGI